MQETDAEFAKGFEEKFFRESSNRDTLAGFADKGLRDQIFKVKKKKFEILQNALNFCVMVEGFADRSELLEDKLFINKLQPISVGVWM